MSKALAAIALLAAAGAAWPQSSTSQKPEDAKSAPTQPPQRPASDQPPKLNLRLDNAGRYATESAPSDKLPELGGSPQTSSRAFERSSPYPKDTNPNK